MRPADSHQTETGSGPSYAERFAASLLSPSRPPPTIVAGPRSKGAEKRYGVYRNNVTVSLVNALAAVFPATERITGSDFFAMMAREHVRTTPPTSPLLFEYGREFPNFIETYEHTSSMPWLADIARIERAWLDAYHAADAVPLSPDAFAAVPHERLAEVVLIPHPATHVLRSPFSALTIFSANRASDPVPRIDASRPEDALITRPALNVVVRHLPPGGAPFLERLASGSSLGEAVSAAFEECSGFDLAANIAGMIEAGAFVDAH